MKEFNSVEEVIEAVRGGKIVVVMDDEDRENEGDVICAAEFATPENVNFMASYAKGLICMPMHVDYVEKLGLDMMCSVNTDNHGTAFTESIDYKDTTTGISAFERSMTAMKVVEDSAKPEDFRSAFHRCSQTSWLLQAKRQCCHEATPRKRIRQYGRQQSSHVDRIRSGHRPKHLRTSSGYLRLSDVHWSQRGNCVERRLPY